MVADVETHSTPYGRSEIDTLVNNIVSSIIKATTYPEEFDEITTLKSERVPEMSINSYVNRILKSQLVSRESAIIAMIYIKRFIKEWGNEFFNHYTVHRIFLVSIMLASKYIDDDVFNNEVFSKLGGVSLHSMNVMEIEYLNRLGFDLYIDIRDYKRYYYALMR